MNRSGSFYNQLLESVSPTKSVDGYFNNKKQQLALGSLTPLFSPPSPVSNQRYHDSQQKSKSISRSNNSYKRHSTPLPTTKLEEHEKERKVITSEIALFMRCKTRYMHPDFKPIPPSPGGWVTPDRVVEWERTTDTFCEFSPYLIYNKHQPSFPASEKHSKNDWKKAATWIGASNSNGVENHLSSVSGAKPVSEVQQSHKQPESIMKTEQPPQPQSLIQQSYKRHYHTRSWSPQTCNTSNTQQEHDMMYQNQLNQQHLLNRSKRPEGDDFNDHVVNSILKVVDDEPQLKLPTMTERGYCWYQLLQSNTENAFWNNLAIFIKTCSNNQLCTPYFFATFAHTLRMHHASIHLVAIEMESWDLQGQQRTYYTVKPIYMPTMIHQDPISNVAHLLGFPSTSEENMMRLREAGISSETRTILKNHFLL